MSVMDTRKIHDASQLNEDLVLEGDVVIVGTGAGGGYTAEVLAQAGLKVILMEEGAYHTAKTFSQNEAIAMPMLYQEAANQRTKDKNIVVLQGRSVGGSTTVNWTSSFHTPPQTLEFWRDRHDLDAFTDAEMSGYFEAVIKRLNINRYLEEQPNANNRLLAEACDKMGYSWYRVPRNVKNCANSGLCPVGCPINAKQSMLVTTIPAALDLGAEIVHKARVMTITHDGKKASGVEAVALDDNAIHPTGRKISVRARHVVVSAGAIRSPALLMRSNIDDPSNKTGKRTFIHPVSISFAKFKEQVDPFYGAPQTVYSDHFLWPDDKADSDRMGYKLETAPMMPLTAASLGDKSMGSAHADMMRELPHLHAMLALGRDGFNDDEDCGTVELNDDGIPVLDYPITDFMRDGLVHGIENMLEMQFAAGAQYAVPWHIDMPKLSTMGQAGKWLAEADMSPMKLLTASAHVMGGCQMGRDADAGVVDSDGRLYALDNVSVHDGSVFPTSIGSNPQLSIYAMTLRNATKLAQNLGG